MNELSEKEMEYAEKVIFTSEEERTYFSNALLEAEKYNAEHPEVYTEEEFYDRLNKKYGI